MTSLPLGLLNFFNQNTIANPAPLHRAALIAGVVALVASISLGRWLAPHVAGLIVGTFGYWFFSMSWVDTNDSAGLIYTWGLVSVISAFVLIWLIGSARWSITLAALAISAVAALLFGGPLLNTAEAQDFAVDDAAPTALAFAQLPDERPNVYLFVLDGFARPSITEQQFSSRGVEFDISAPLAELEQLGFEQDLEASVNYPQTILSVPSTLNASYPHLPEAQSSAADIWAEGRQALAGNNLLVNSLRTAGYEYWHSSSTIWEASRCREEIADRCLGDPGIDFEASRAVWDETPLRNLVSGNLDRAPDPTTVVGEILAARQSTAEDQPYFLFSHILSPHQPYRFDENCSVRESREGLSLSFGHAPEHRPLYAGEAVCLSNQLVTAMTDLLEADPTALIFLQADHGSAFEVDFDNHSWDEPMVEERFGIFRMTHLPDRCRSDDPAAESVINTVPVIIGCIAGEEPELIDPRILLVNWSPAVEVQESELGLIPQR